jgi:glycosyltransferase involved in cell wall biosynthesis
VPADTLIIYVCKHLPARGGGGHGVAYNFLTAVWGKPVEPRRADHILFAGQAELHLPSENPDLDVTLAALDVGAKHGFQLLLWQVARINELAKSYHTVVVIGFTPFYLWRLLDHPPGGRLIAVHTEHSKGGRHFELAEESGRFGLKERFVRWCVGLNFSQSDHIVFPSRGALSLFTGMNAPLAALADEKAAIVYNGVAPSPEPPPRPSRDHLKIASVAHHVREKGLDTLLDGLALAKKAGVAWDFVNYGQPSNLTDELKAHAEKAGIASQIRFEGLKPQAVVRADLGDADVFLHTPVIVVFDLSLLEAMMHALPVVTVPLEGNREALGEDYPLFAGNAEEVAEKLQWIAAHPEETRRIGTALRTRALERFTNDAMVGSYAAFLSQAAGMS